MPTNPSFRQNGEGVTVPRILLWAGCATIFLGAAIGRPILGIVPGVALIIAAFCLHAYRAVSDKAREPTLRQGDSDE